MLSMKPVTSAMFPDIYEPLLRDWNPLISEAMWRSVFANPRAGEDTCFGYALADDGRIVGVMGMYFSERTIRGRTARFCNLHNWKVLPEYRSKSFMLMRPAIALKEHTLTDLSAVPDVAEMMIRLGFQEIDSAALVLPQLPWSKTAAGVTLEEMSGEPAEYTSRLSAADLRIYEDHRPACGHLLVSTAAGDCYIVYSRVQQRLRPHCYAHYVTNPRLLAEHHAAIRAHLLRTTGTRFVVLDARLVSEASIPYSFRVRGRPKLFRPYQTEGRDVDTLYTEIAFLKHSALSSLRPRLLTAASRKISSALGRAS